MAWLIALGDSSNSEAANAKAPVRPAASKARNRFRGAFAKSFIHESFSLGMKWFTEFGHLNRGDMLTSEQHRCHN
ncbi:hypothetical protein HMPREF0774_2115, partial [Staphylococcus aureus subsp. aureus TCH130]